MFTKLREKIKEKLKEEIKEELFARDSFDFHFTFKESVKQECEKIIERIFDNINRGISPYGDLRKSIVASLDRLIKEKDYKVVEDNITQRIWGEEFIDGIVKRINEKQIGK